MPCESMRKPNQTLTQRKDEVRKRAKKIDQLIVSGKVKVKVGPQGAITFNGIELADRDGLTDGCIYRMLSRFRRSTRCTSVGTEKGAVLHPGQPDRGVDRRAAGIPAYLTAMEAIDEVARWRSTEVWTLTVDARDGTIATTVHLSEADAIRCLFDNHNQADLYEYGDVQALIDGECIVVYINPHKLDWPVAS